MKNALISVSDKSGVVEFAQGLEPLGFRIISTGGTYKLLKEAGVQNLMEVSEFTGSPEGLDGRIKTLTPQVFGGILALRNDPSHQQFLKENHMEEIDLVVVNLYPFKATYENPDATEEQKIENIDIGGPSMIRAAAKNWQFCSPVVDPADYKSILEEYESGDLAPQTRKSLARKAFAMTAHYDLMIARFWEEICPAYTLRYGENPHQKAVVIPDPFAIGPNLVGAKILNGKPLSYNNFNDAGGALELALSFEEPFVAIIKHATPCGAAVGTDIADAFTKAYEADTMSAFGGVIACNREIDALTATKITSFFNEIVLAPSYSTEALEILKKKPNLRVLEIPNFGQGQTTDMSMRRVRGGTLVQELDVKEITEQDLKYPTEKKPSKSELADLLMAWRLVKIIKSNAICVVKDGVMIGKGGGQTSRIEAMEIALHHAKEAAKGAVLASDAFFPFPDGVEAAAAAGIAAIIQPGGAKKDAEVFAKSNELGVATVLTGTRAFLH